MCGIAAILSAEGCVPERAVQGALDALHHRGPDGRGQWRSSDGAIQLGHTRLSIIDLITGDQPIANEDESMWIVANGEFYGFEQIRNELQGRGHRFRTQSDSEIALHLYEDLGPECLHELRGEFAFVIWDGQNRRLFAARDRFGVKPLFYAEWKGALYLASEVKALFAMGVPAVWSSEALSAGGFVVPGERTLFKHVHNLPPGHFLRATRESLRMHQYWDIDYPADPHDAAEDPSGVRSEAEAVEGFRLVLEDAVKTRLRADVPVGCYLSGGIDSSAIVGLAARHQSQPIRTYTLTFESPQYDESAIAAEMAQHAGVEYFPVSVTQADLAAHFKDAVLQAELPCLNAHSVAKYMLSRAVRESGHKVVLTGEGSDEILGGYPHFRRDMLLFHTRGQSMTDVQRLLQELENTNQVSRGLLMPDGEADSSAICEGVLGFVPSWVDTQAGLVRRVKQLMRDDLFGPLGGADVMSNVLASIDVRRRLAGRNAVHAAMYLWAKTSLPHYILTNLGDRMEMAHSVEGRVPFMDHHVAEYLQRVPVALKIRGMTEKYILREAVKDVVTNTVYDRQKHPFLSPPATLHPNEPLHALLQDTLRGSAAGAVPFFDRKKLIAALDAVADGGMDLGARVVMDQALTIAMSYVFLHEGLGVAS